MERYWQKDALNRKDTWWELRNYLLVKFHTISARLKMDMRELLELEPTWRRTKCDTFWINLWFQQDLRIVGLRGRAGGERGGGTRSVNGKRRAGRVRGADELRTNELIKLLITFWTYLRCGDRSHIMSHLWRGRWGRKEGWNRKRKKKGWWGKGWGGEGWGEDGDGVDEVRVEGWEGDKGEETIWNKEIP